MRRFLYICVLLLSLAPAATAQQAQLQRGNSEYLREQLEKHVYTLAHDSMRGRKALSAESIKAADYIEGEFRKAGLSPWVSGYSQYFIISSSGIRANNTDGIFRNVIGFIEGSDPILKSEYIIIGAHYDHLGTIYNDGREVVYNGADDNASGTAVIIELARRLAETASQHKRSILFVAFDGEEIGLYGSYHLADNFPFRLSDVKLAVSVDMVGWYSTSGELKLEGAGTIKNGSRLLDNPLIIPQGLNLNVRRFETNPMVATDTQPFAARGVPTLAVTTGLKSPYHKPEDVPELIDYDGMALITEYLTSLIREIASDTDFDASGRVAYKHNEGGRRIEFGVMLSTGSNYHQMTSGPLRGKSAFVYGAGLTVQTRLSRSLLLGTGAGYERVGARYTGGNVWSDNVTVPLAITLRSRGVGQLFVSAGGYYRYALCGTVGDSRSLSGFSDNFYRNEYGAQYSVGAKLGKLSVGTVRRYGLTDMLRNSGSGPNIRNRSTQFFIAYTL